ncbi:hypothetical protein AAC387_Pa12g0900 [Persea americana]
MTRLREGHGKVRWPLVSVLASTARQFRSSAGSTGSGSLPSQLGSSVRAPAQRGSSAAQSGVPAQQSSSVTRRSCQHDRPLPGPSTSAESSEPSSLNKRALSDRGAPLRR